MLKHSISAFLFLLPISLLSQTEDDRRFSRFQTITLNLEKAEQTVALPISFSSIEVIDVRPDTTNLGMPDHNNSNLLYAITKGRFTDQVKNYYTKALVQSASNNPIGSLYCFIRKLVLSDFIQVKPTHKELDQQPEKPDWLEKSGLIIKIGYYLKEGDVYIPAFRFDTVLTGSKNVENKGSDYLSEAIWASIRKAQLVSWEKIRISGKKLNWESVQKFNQGNISHPILLNKPNKGVFLSFEDFRNNKVQYPAYTVSYDNKGDFLYIKDPSGQETLLVDFWGYSDGNNVYIHLASNFFKLYRFGNSFKFYGAKDYTQSRVIRAHFGLLDLVNTNSTYSKAKTRARFDLVKDFLQLDLETGEIY